MDELKYWIGAAVIAVLLAMAPVEGRTAPLPAGEAFCELVADSAHVAATARQQGLLLSQYESEIERATPHNPEMRKLLIETSVIVYTTDDFAGLSPDAALRRAYQSCMSVYN